MPFEMKISCNCEGHVLGYSQVEPSGDIRDLQPGPQPQLHRPSVRVRRVPSLPQGEGGALHGGALQQDWDWADNLVPHQSWPVLHQARGPVLSLHKTCHQGILMEMNFNEADQVFEFIYRVENTTKAVELIC